MPKTTKSGGVNLTSPVTVLSGVGPAKAAAYAKAGIETLEDLLLHIPRAYENRGDIRLLSESHADGGKTAVVLVGLQDAANNASGLLPAGKKFTSLTGKSKIENGKFTFAANGVNYDVLIGE